jgi:DNA-3-methyladenine glycosylase
MPPPRPLGKSSQIRPLTRSFFARNALVRQADGSRLTARIVEVEAYLGENDPAAHSAAGRTARNSVLFGPPGYAYVYFIYGFHYCLNVSCEREGKAGGVLFRALEPLTGVEEMARARGIELPAGGQLKDLPKKDLPKLTSGPGRLSEAFGITRDRDNGCDLTSAASSLWIGNDGYQARGIRVTPRIGITKAADHPLRYLIGGNPFVSGRKIDPKKVRPLQT